MKPRRLLAFVCLLALMTGCSPKEGETKGDALLRQAKKTGKILSEALAEGIRLEAQLAAAGDIDPAIEPNLKQWLQDGKTATDAFNERAASYTKFDAQSKADIAKFADDAVAFIEKMNTEGILRIRNPKSQAIATGIISGARIATRILKSQADDTAVVPA